MSGATRSGVRCAVCQQAIHGSYYTNSWNLPFHSYHSTCDACGHPTAELGQHPLCRSCRPSVVNQPTVATARARAVRRCLERRGIVIGSRSVRYGLARVPNPGHNSLGIARATWSRAASGSSSCRIDIVIKRGLPALQFDAVVAHELTHAWLRIRDVSLPDVVEEGVAELTSFWFLGYVGGSRAAAIQHQIATNRDHIYGRGFRMAMKAEQRHGWSRVADALLRTGHLPR